MTDTRGPAPGKVPPHVRDRLEQKRRKAAERAEKGPPWLRPPALAAYGAVLLVIGLAIGMALSGDPEQAAADQVTQDVLPIANQAEALWRIGLADVPALADAAAALEATGDVTAIEANHQAWIDEHRRLLDELDRLELDPVAAAVADLFRAHVRAQLDAVVLLGAAVAHEGSARTELARAAAREIGRSRALLEDARAALEAMGGPEALPVDVPIVPGLTPPGGELPEPLQDPSAGTDPGGDDESGVDEDPEGQGASTDEEQTTEDPPDEPSETTSPS